MVFTPDRFLSGFLRDMMSDYFPNGKNVSLVPRGVNIEEFFPRDKNRKLMAKYKISKNEKVIITVANLVPVKGIEILLDTFSSSSATLNK